MSNCFVEEISDFAFSIGSLVELNLSNNNLTKLVTNAFSGARSLKILNLSFNSISVIESNIFEDLYSLIDLNLSHNYLNNGSFSSSWDETSVDWNIENLQTLDLSHNQIYYYQVMPYQSFSGLKRLESLNLSYNNITLDYGSFSSNQYLKTLDISYNAFVYFEMDFLLSVRSLENLFLSGNGLSYASQIELSDVRSSFPALRSLTLSENLFACEVLAAMLRKLDKAGIDLRVDEKNFVKNTRNLRGVKCL